MNDVSIGQLAAMTSVKVQTIRYYESIGLLREPHRTASNRRVYGQADVQRLSFIRHARELGFSVNEIRSMLVLQDQPQRSCTQVDDIARRRLADVEDRLVRLNSLKVELRRMIDQCEGGSIASCNVIEALCDHSQCLSDDHGGPGRGIGNQQ